MTTKLSVPEAAPSTRWMVRVAELELNFDFAGSTFQIPASEAANAICGIDATNINAAKEATMVWRAGD
jgi:hypothetical protein